MTWFDVGFLALWYGIGCLSTLASIVIINSEIRRNDCLVALALGVMGPIAIVFGLLGILSVISIGDTVLWRKQPRAADNHETEYSGEPAIKQSTTEGRNGQ